MMSATTSPGRVIAVVGPSGVGKDSVIAGLCAASPDLHLARRVITRDPELGGEDFDSVDADTFEDLNRNGAFCLSWQVHGLQYGIPIDILSDTQSGQNYLVNLSRTVLAQAQKTFPSFTVLSLTAKPETLAARLSERARESIDDIRKRLDRTAAIPKGIERFDISNDGPLDQTIQSALAALGAIPHPFPIEMEPIKS